MGSYYWGLVAMSLLHLLLNRGAHRFSAGLLSPWLLSPWLHLSSSQPSIVFALVMIDPQQVQRCYWGWYKGVTGADTRVLLGLVQRCYWGWYKGVTGAGTKVLLGLIQGCYWGWYRGVTGADTEVLLGLIQRCYWG